MTTLEILEIIIIAGGNDSQLVQTQETNAEIRLTFFKGVHLGWYLEWFGKRLQGFFSFLKMIKTDKALSEKSSFPDFWLNGPKRMVNRKFLEIGSNDFSDFWPELGDHIWRKLTQPDFPWKICFSDIWTQRSQSGSKTTFRNFRESYHMKHHSQ